MTNQKYDWSSVDWVNLNDCMISRQLGCSRERVRQVRAGLGKPLSRYYRARASYIEGMKKARAVFDHDPDNLLTDREIAELTGAGLERVTKLRISLGLGTVRAIPRYEYMNFRLSDTDLGKIWGYSGSVPVTVLRSRLEGIPKQMFDYQSQRHQHWDRMNNQKYREMYDKEVLVAKEYMRSTPMCRKAYGA